MNLESKCVICNKPVDPDSAHKTKYIIHEKCFNRVSPSSKRHPNQPPDQRTGDEPV